MSASYYLKDVASNPWLKLYIYIRFRVISEGLWINTSPGLWFRAIMNEETIIDEIIDGDTGSPMDNYSISVYKRYNPEKVLFGISLTYDSANSASKTFVKRAKKVYDYTRGYGGEANGWLESALELYWDDEEEMSVLDIESWNKLFGPFDNTGMVNLKSFNFSSVDPLLPKIFGLLASLHDYGDLIKDIDFDDAVSKDICRAKEWALLALLEMVRYYCTAT